MIMITGRMAELGGNPGALGEKSPQFSADWEGIARGA